MDVVREDRLLAMELQTLCEESVRRSQSVEKDDYEPRRLFALAQVAGCRDLMQYLIENEEWSEFGEFLETILGNEESRYWRALESGDRRIMIIAMAHRRQCKKLARRLTDPRRRQSLLPQLEEPAKAPVSWLQSQLKILSLNQ